MSQNLGHILGYPNPAGRFDISKSQLMMVFAGFLIKIVIFHRLNMWPLLIKLHQLIVRLPADWCMDPMVQRAGGWRTVWIMHSCVSQYHGNRP